MVFVICVNIFLTNHREHRERRGRAEEGMFCGDNEAPILKLKRK
ncbi:hypothetical protein NIES80_11210 [Dolichospermum planctonicum]|uniref:Uncharacterized protein n=1 Tax=Dolichospermum planctonicum TaxID=136072 RepID=A0A480ABU2_9CYAN|nr:hypothetical protein NIES80_11210 [Dolichospermum planctonicum]